MKVPFKRQKPPKARALDVLASVAKLWSELQLSKRAGKGVAKGAKKAASARDAVRPGSRKSRLGSTPVKAIGAAALVGAVGAAARKLLGGKSEPDLMPSPAEPPPASGTTGGPAAPEPVTAVPKPVSIGDEAIADESDGDGVIEKAPTLAPAPEPPASPKPEEPATGEPADEPPTESKPGHGEPGPAAAGDEPGSDEETGGS
jgi:hypothetical protein